jgi:hypothetical protein
MVAFGQPATHQTEWRSNRTETGSPVTATVRFSTSSIQTIPLRWVNHLIGSPVTTTVTFAPPLQTAVLQWQNALIDHPVTTTFAFAPPPQTTALCWTAKRTRYSTATVQFCSGYHNTVTASVVYTYDRKIAYQTTGLCYRHWLVVPAGWRIVARNIETGKSLDLGFIDAGTENKALEDVFLPDGDYEIVVLTSSLFWRDCLDRTVRTIAIRPGEEVTPLPTIYNLRSAVLDGVTTIRWSANQSDLDDCVFGIWYDSQSPVDTNRIPDQTVGYFSLQTEYATTFFQNAPAYVAIAAMRNGSGEIGKVHELYLDWSHVPPHRPDDVILLDKPLPAIDSSIAEKNADDLSLSLWF